MKKDIEWLRNKLVYLHKLDMWNWNQCEPNSREQRHFGGCLAAYEKALDFLDELDEPEVLSQKWISEKSIDTHVDTVNGDIQVTFILDDLENLIVPKKEELESKIQKLIEAYKKEDGVYSNPENAWIDGFITDLECLSEEEQKYYVKDSKGSYILAKIKGEVMTMGEILEFYGHESVDIGYNLTEQEIKGYDSRYWAFAVPVEELEE